MFKLIHVILWQLGEVNRYYSRAANEETEVQRSQMQGTEEQR